ncbi:hypothetical protein CW304_26200 [Bacillus sp. UFRGS-B20]|nr:hypothetical protein CW304_26200 [Bacillus sp. UFRGS-B20]
MNKLFMRMIIEKSEFSAGDMRSPLDPILLRTGSRFRSFLQCPASSDYILNGSLPGFRDACPYSTH